VTDHNKFSTITGSFMAKIGIGYIPNTIQARYR